MKRRLLSLCLRAYPRSLRDRDGDVLLDLACDLADHGRVAMVREAAGLVRAGAGARLAAAGGDLRALPWRDALGVLALPLAVANATVWAVGLGTILALDNHGPVGLWWAVVAGGSAAALGGIVAGDRRLASVGALAVLLPVGYHAFEAWNVSAQPRFGMWFGWTLVDVSVAWLPAVALLAAACAAGTGRARPRIRTAAAGLALPAALGALAVLTTDPLNNSHDALTLGNGQIALTTLITLLAAVLVGATVVGVRRGGAVAPAVALALAALSPEGIWLAAGALPLDVSGPTVALALLALPTLIVATACLALALRGERAASG